MIKSLQQVLITGVYRSGTEYITHLLNNHPALNAHMYVVSFMRFCWNRYNPIVDPYNYTRLLFDAAQRIQYRWNRQLDVFEIIEELDGERVSYASLYDALMVKLFCEKPKARWAEKTQLAWTKIAPFLDMFPDGKAILVIRDPRNVLLSFKKYTYAPEPAYLGAAFNCLGAMQTGRQLIKDYGEGRVHILRYEDVITDAERTLNNVFSFLDLPVTHDLLNKEGWVDELGNPWHANSVFVSDQEKAISPSMFSYIDRWKDELNLQEIGLCEAVVGDQLEYFGYGQSGQQKDWPGMLKLLRQDASLWEYFCNWLDRGVGIEAFPTDPLVKENWASSNLASLS